jgi:hypothetical protein
MNSNWSDYERFLKPIHLKGAILTLTVTRITEEDTHPRPGETVKNPVLWFKELPFGMILSPTNRATLIDLYGDSVRDSIGKPIAVKAVTLKVGGKDKQPLRIQRQRPNAPHVEPTGEIIDPVETLPATSQTPATSQAPAMSPVPAAISQPPSANRHQPTASNEPPLSPEGESELDAIFGPNPRLPKQTALPADDKWPTTQEEYSEWSKARGINGKETYGVLGETATAWMKKNNKGWSDVAKTVQATLGK